MIMTETIDVIPCNSSNTQKLRMAREFPGRLKEISNDTIRICKGAVYKGSIDGVDVVCMVCNHEWSPAPNNLVNIKQGCPECYKQRQRDSRGIQRKRKSTPAERELAKRMRHTGMTYQAIAALLNRSHSVVVNWIDPEQAKRSNEACAKAHEKYRSNGESLERQRAYRQTPHGAASRKVDIQKRRALMYHCFGNAYIPDHPDANPEGWVEYDLTDLITTAEDREAMSFVGADDDAKKRAKQQRLLEKISGERYSLEHLIPLSCGGIHHPANFANRALSLNCQKGNKRLQADDELFAKRIFGMI